MKEFKNINDILDFAINAEQEAVEFYTSLADRFSDSNLKEVFEQFAREEVSHKAKLMTIKSTGTLNPGEKHITDLKVGDYLVDIEPKPGMSYQDALVIAMKKEKAAFKLYMDLSEKTGDPLSKSLFLSLAMEESKHKLRFEIEYDEYVLREN